MDDFFLVEKKVQGKTAESRCKEELGWDLCTCKKEQCYVVGICSVKYWGATIFQMLSKELNFIEPYSMQYKHLACYRPYTDHMYHLIGMVIECWNQSWYLISSGWCWKGSGCWKASQVFPGNWTMIKSMKLFENLSRCQPTSVHFYCWTGWPLSEETVLFSPSQLLWGLSHRTAGEMEERRPSTSDGAVGFVHLKFRSMGWPDLHW